MLRQLTVASFTLMLALPAWADIILFATGSPDGRLGAATRPPSTGKIENEAADDFLNPVGWTINSATFTGLITGATPTIGQVGVEIYRVFPNDSLNPPSGNVPTRVNSPSDNAFDTRDVTLSFTTTVLASSFTAANSVLNGINKSPNQTTGGEGAVTGMEVLFTVNFASPLNLPPDHYFFVPQVQVTGGEFYWLSTARPVTGQFAFTPDLQAWIRNANLDPDWLRIGTDIIGGTSTFNMTFALDGTAVPEPSTFGLLLAAAAFLAWKGRRARR